MANYSQDNNGLMSWLIIIFMLLVFPPIGLLLLFRKLMNETGGRNRSTGQHPYDVRWASQNQNQNRNQSQNPYQNQSQTVPPVKQQPQGNPATKAKHIPLSRNRGNSMTIIGIILAVIFGIGTIGTLTSALAADALLKMLPAIIITLGFACAGLVVFYSGMARTRQTKRWFRYLALIGKRETVSVTSLAEAMPTTVRKAWDDLQDMLENGVLPRGYLDPSSRNLVLTEDGLPVDQPKAKQESAPKGMEREDAVLAEIKEVNDSIENPELSRKIDRVGEITGKIFAYLRENPDKEDQLRSFLSYYLPTTLKVLRAYAQMEAQDVEGENIKATKARIEGMMDKVVEGFEAQLDKLFQNNAMDITSDVAVLEQMLKNDGLSQGDGLQIGG